MVFLPLPELADDDVAAPLVGVEAGFDSVVDDFSEDLSEDFSDDFSVAFPDDSELSLLLPSDGFARESLR